MKREPTQAAQVAAIIRKELKKYGIKARVKSENYSMGNSVDVYLGDELPATIKRIKAFCAQFEAGSFDGMTDCYTYRKDRKGPTTKYLFINTEYSEELKQECWEWIRGYYADAENAPEELKDAGNVWIMNNYAPSFVYQVLANDGPFWRTRKPRIQAAA